MHPIQGQMGPQPIKASNVSIVSTGVAHEIWKGDLKESLLLLQDTFTCYTFLSYFHLLNLGPSDNLAAIN